MNIRNEVHAMEHGRIEIHYKPSLPESAAAGAEGRLRRRTLTACCSTPIRTCPTTSRSPPGPTMAVCPHYNPVVLDVIRNFRDTYRGNGPEQQIPIHVG